MEKFIKVLNPDDAQKLIDLGFRYIPETMNGEPVYSFFFSEELMTFANQNLAAHSFLLSSKITF